MPRIDAAAGKDNGTQKHKSVSVRAAEQQSSRSAVKDRAEE